LSVLQRVRILLRNRAWRRLADECKRGQNYLAANPSLGPQAEASLLWLGQEAKAFADAADGADLSSMLAVTKAVLPLLPEKSFPLLRSRLGKLNGFFDLLTTAEKECRDRGAPAADKLTKWLRNQAGKVPLDPDKAHACLYANPERWPTLAAALDPRAFQAAAPLLAAARGNMELRKKNYGTARKHFENALAKDPACIRALEGLASVHVKTDNQAEAIRLYREAIRTGASDPSTFNNFAWYVCQGPEPREAELREALWAARRAVEIAPLAGIWDTLAEVYARLGDLELAIAATREAIRIDPERQSFRQRMRGLCAALTAAASAAGNESGIRAGKDKDIFETDFEVPALEEESGSQVAALDTDLDSSDFDLALGDSDVTPGDDSGSEVVGLDEEVPDDAAATVAAKRKTKHKPTADLAEDVDLGFDQLDEDAVEALEGRRRDSHPSRPSAPAKVRGSFGPAASDQRDPVDCSVFAPPEAALGDSFLVQVFAHMPEQAEAAKASAQEFDSDALRRGTTSLGTEIPRGNKLTFELHMAGLKVDEPVQELVWRGCPHSVQFDVGVSGGHKPRTIIGKVLVSQEVAVTSNGQTQRGNVPIGEIKFKLKLVQGACDGVNEPAGQAQRFTKAFISYASQDRNKVLQRVQMLAAAGIQFFQDVLDLDPGDRWARELFRHIDDSDVLFLFWSHFAKESKWVEKEWRYGLEKKGNDFIRPVIIEGPPIVPPPKELAHLHFNDKVLYFMQAS
jgi:tetratricopeptide (TPR) repeat protein